MNVFRPTSVIIASLAVLVAWASAFQLGCVRSAKKEVIVYTALDRDFSESIFADFQKQTGIQVRASYDTESTKTVQLTNAIIAESRRRTRCDLFWNNEILNTLRLDQLGLLDSYTAKNSDQYPERFRSSDDRWYGFAARARVLLVNRQRVDEQHMPASVFDLVDPRWKGKVAVAKPLFGTTATHAACMWETLGESQAKGFWQQLRQNAQIMSGNKQVAQAVSRGEVAFGLTDTDDAKIEVQKGFPVSLVYPDQQPGGMGTLFIPNSLALLRGSPNAQAARQLLDYLLSAEVEEKLAQGPSAQIPLNTTSQKVTGIETTDTIRPMEVDFEAAALRWSEVGSFLAEEFVSRPPASRH